MLCYGQCERSCYVMLCCAGAVGRWTWGSAGYGMGVGVASSCGAGRGRIMPAQVGLCEVMQCYADAGRGRNATGPGRLARCVSHSTPRYPYKCTLSIYIISHDFLKSAIIFRKSAIIFQKSAMIYGQKSAMSFRKSAMIFRKSAFIFRKSAFIFRKSAFKYQKSAFIYRKSTLNSLGISGHHELRYMRPTQCVRPALERPLPSVAEGPPVFRWFMILRPPARLGGAARTSP